MTDDNERPEVDRDIPEEEGDDPSERLIEFMRDRYSTLGPQTEVLGAEEERDAEVTMEEGDGPPDPASQLSPPSPDYYYNLIQDYHERQIPPDTSQGPQLRAAPIAPPGENWLPLGPSVVNQRDGSRLSVSGRTVGLGVANGGNTIFAASANGGVWRSDDAGITWRSKMNDFDEDPVEKKSDSLACGAIAIDPANPNSVFVGTGEGSGSGYWGVGPIISVDGGTTWATENVAAGAPSLRGSGFYAMALDPADATRVVAATRKGIYRREPNPAGGFHWVQKALGAANVIATSVVVAQRAGATVFYAARHNQSIYVSNDNGDTWAVTGAGFPANEGRISLAVRPNNADAVYAFTQQAHIYRLDLVNDPTWRLIANAPPAADLLGLAGANPGQGWYDLAIAVAPNNVNLIYVGGSGQTVGGAWIASLYRCEIIAVVGNVRMNPTSIGESVHADIQALVFTPANADSLWVACDGGVYHSSRPTDVVNLNTLFDSRNIGLATMTMNYLGQHPSQDAVVFSGTQDNGGERSLGDNVWVRSAPGDAGYVVVDWNNPYRVAITITKTTIRIYNDGGVPGPGVIRRVPIAAGEQVRFYAPLAGTPPSAIPADANTLAFGSTRPWISSNFGQNWASIPNNTPADNLPNKISALALASVNRLYVGTEHQPARPMRIMRYDRAAGAWAATRLDNLGAVPALVGPVAAIVVDLADPTGMSIYIAYGGTGDFRHIWHFDGAAWAARSGPAAGGLTSLPDVQFNAVVVDPLNTATVYAAADIGIWRSLDSGGTWQPFSAGLPDASVLDLQIFPLRRLLRAATHGRGIFERQLDTSPSPLVKLYMRKTVLDRGLYPALDGLPDPSVPPGQFVNHRNGPGIKVSNQAGGAFPLPPAIDFLQFAEKLTDDSAAVTAGAPIRAYIELYNWGVFSDADNIQLRLLIANDVMAGTPALPSNLDLFMANNLPLTAPGWASVGAATVNDLIAGDPKIISFDIAAALLPPAGRQGCLLVLVSQADDVFALPKFATVFEFTQPSSITQAVVNTFPAGPVSIAFWARMNQAATTPEKAFLFSYGNQPGDPSRHLWIKNPLNLEVGFGASSTGATGVSIRDGNWHHLTVIVSPNGPTNYRIEIYRDGAPVYDNGGAVVHAAAVTLQNDLQLALGQDVLTPNTQFLGWMSDLRIWDGARTHAQILSDMTSRLAGNEAVALYWTLDSSATAGVIAGGRWVTGDLSLYQNGVRATWTAVAGATYEFQLQTAAGANYAHQTGLTQTALTISSPFPTLNQPYTGKVRAKVGGVDGAWSADQHVTIRYLGQPRLSLNYDPTAKTLTASWQAIPQAAAYRIQTFQYDDNGVTVSAELPAPAGTSVDLTNQLGADNASRIEVRAVTDSSYGPANLTTALADKPGIDFTFRSDVTGDTWNARWSFDSPWLVQFYYLQVFNGLNHAVLHQQTIFAPGQTTVDLPTAGINEGDSFNARIRPVAQGTIGLWSQNLTLTVHRFSKPVVTFTIAADATITAHWPDVRTPAQVTAGVQVTYQVELYKNGALIQTDSVANNGLQYVLPEKANTVDTYGIQVRASADRSIGAWSDMAAALATTLSLYFDYDGATGAVSASWLAAAGSAGFYLEVYRGNSATGAPIYRETFPNTQFTQVIPAAVTGTLHEGDQLYGRMRVLAAGIIGGWSDSALTVHFFTQPTPTFAYNNASAELSITWPAVMVGVPPQPAGALAITYEVAAYKNADVAAFQTYTPATVSQLLPVAWADTNDTYRVQVRATANNSRGPWSAVAGSPPVPTLTLNYIYDGAVGQLNASWTMTPAPDLFYLKAEHAAAKLHAEWPTTAQNNYNIAGTSGLVEGDDFSGMIRALAQGVIGSWVTVAGVAHQFDAPVVAFSFASVALSANWNDIRRNPSQTGLIVAYAVSIYRGAEVAPFYQTTIPANGLTAPMPAELLGETQACRVHVQGTLDHSIGLANAPAALAAPAVTLFQYDYTAGNFPSRWSADAAAQYNYYEALNSASAVVASDSTAGGVGEATYALTQAVQKDSAYHLQVKRFSNGAVSAYSTPPADLSAYQMDGPFITKWSSDKNAHTISVWWQFSYEAVADIDYVVDVTVGGTAIPPQMAGPNNKQITITNASFVEGAECTVRVRAAVGHALGLWSSPQTVVVGSTLGQVQNLSVQSYKSGDLQMTWAAVPNAAQYKLQIFPKGGNAPAYSKNDVPGNPTTFALPIGTSGLTVGNQYDVRMAAVSAGGGDVGPWSERVTVKVGEPAKCDQNTCVPVIIEDPINAATGTYSYSSNDISVPAVMPLIFTTYYNTFSALPTDNPGRPNIPIGNRWNHSYNITIEASSDGKTVGVFWGTGAVDVYNVPSSKSGYYQRPGIPNGDTLFRDPNSGYVLRAKNQTQYLFTNNGVLTRIVSPQGNTTTLSYTGDALTQVKDDGSGKSLTLAYDGSGRVHQVTDLAGRFIRYDYFPNGDLKTFTDVGNHTRQFTYDSPSLMKMAIDQNQITIVMNRYQDGKVAYQMDGRGGVNTPNYGSTLQYATATLNGQTVNRTQLVDRAGNTSFYYSDTDNSLVYLIVEQLGNNVERRTAREYDAFNSLIAETVYEGPPTNQNIGNTTRYSYDNNRNLLSVTDPLLQTTTYTYDGNNNYQSITDQAGNTTQIRFDAQNRLYKVTNPFNQERIYTYYEDRPIKGLIHTLQDELGNITSYDYDTSGNLTQIVDPYGNITSYGYDPRVGLVNSITRKGANQHVLQVTAYTYWDQGWVHTYSTYLADQPQSEAFTYQYDYDNAGNLTSIKNPLVNQTIYRYDENNNLHFVLYPPDPDQSGIVYQTQYDYDRNDNRSRVDYGAGATQQSTYDPLQRIKTFTDGRQQQYVYDYSMVSSNPFQLQRKITYPVLAEDPSNTYYGIEVYDAANRLVSTQSPGTGKVDLAYTVVHDSQTNTYRRVVTSAYPKYDPSQPTPYTTSQTYDALNRLVAVKDANGKTTTIAYSKQAADVRGTFNTVQTTTDVLQNQTINTYDALNRLISTVVGKSGDVTQQIAYGYDPLDRLTSVTEQKDDGTNLQTIYSYSYDSSSKTIKITITGPRQTARPAVLQFDGAQNLVSETDQQGHSIAYTYMRRGLLKTWKNGRDQTIAYDYDLAGRFTTQTIAGGDAIKHILDENANRTTTQLNSQDQVLRTYDHWNRLTKRTDLYGKDVQYGYKPSGALDTLTYPDNKQVRYGYDGLNRLHTVTDWNQRTTTYNYRPSGQVSSIDLIDGHTVAYHFDDAGRLTGLRDSQQDFVLCGESYVLDAIGRRKTSSAILPLAPALTGTAQSATYNDANQIISRNNSAPFTYDNDGNLTLIADEEINLSYNAYNQLSAADQTQYSYDVEGLRVQVASTGGTTRYVQDVNGYLNPMLNIADPVRSLQNAATVNDLFGAMLSAPADLNDPDEARRLPLYVPNNGLNRVLEETNASGDATRRYVYGLGLINSYDANDTCRVYHYDSRGSTVALTDLQGVLTDAYAYDPYGRLTGRTGTTPNPFLYNGRDGVMTDSSNMVFMRARYYNPALTSFLQKDFLFGDIYFPQTINRYAYVGRNPISLIDPFGLKGKNDNSDNGGSSWWKWVVGVGAAVLVIGGIVVTVLTFAPELGLFGLSVGGGEIAVGTGVELTSLTTETATVSRYTVEFEARTGFTRVLQNGTRSFNWIRRLFGRPTEWEGFHEL